MITHTIRIRLAALALLVCAAGVHALDAGWQLNVKGQGGGSLTVPSISAGDRNKLSANKLNGMLGYGFGGEVSVGYVWDSADAFCLGKDNVFSGIGLFGGIGISQGYAGQIAGSHVLVGGEERQVDVYMNIYYAPVVSFAVAGRTYFFDNRFMAGLSVGMKMIADPTPQYEMYSTDANAVPSEVGTILVDNDMMRSMNPFMATIKLELEYNVPIISNVGLILGGYGAFNIYSPGYITMPQTMINMMQGYQESQGMTVFNPKTTKLSSYFINSFDFGVTLGIAVGL